MRCDDPLHRRLQPDAVEGAGVRIERGLERSVEVGPNKVIAGIMKRIDKAHPIDNVTV